MMDIHPELPGPSSHRLLNVTSPDIHTQSCMHGSQNINISDRNVPVQTSAAEDEADDEDVNMSFPNVLSSHTDSLLGIGYPTYVTPVSTPINSQISASIQQKIFQNKFVDFSLLLPSDSIPQGNSKFQLQVDAEANISLVPSQKTKKITSIEAWTTAFLRFVSVYAVRFPFETSTLMKYGEIIRDLSQRRPGAAFVFYDTQFRMLRQTIPHPWDRLHMEFWLLASTQASPMQSSTQPRPFRVQQKGGQNNKRQKFLENTCWAFNKRGTCNISMCRHPHICGFCRGQHSAIACPNKPRDRSINNIATSSPSPIASRTTIRPAK